MISGGKIGGFLGKKMADLCNNFLVDKVGGFLGKK